MKKVLSLILALAMVIALVACGEKQPASDGDASSDGDKSARGNVIMTFGTADTGQSAISRSVLIASIATSIATDQPAGAAPTLPLALIV